VGAEDVVEVEPVVGEAEEVVGVLGLEEVGTVELFVVGAMASFDTAIVALATEGVTAEIATQGFKVASGEASYLGEVVAAELLAPVGLEGDVGVEVVGSQPHEYEEHEGDAIGAIEPMAVGQEAEASTAVTGGPLIAWETLTVEMGGSFSA
jgi:hypothetical protein